MMSMKSWKLPAEEFLVRISMSQRLLLFSNYSSVGSPWIVRGNRLNTT